MNGNKRGPLNEDPMTGKKQGICNSNDNVSNFGRGMSRGNTCKRNILSCEKLGRGKGFYNVGFSEKEIYEARKQSLEKELEEINKKLENLK